MWTSPLFEFIGNKIQQRYNPACRAGVLYFHRVLERSDPFNTNEITTVGFSRLMDVLSEHFEFSCTSTIKEPALSGRPKLAITFDDGYRDNLLNALPILKQHKAPVTIFVASGGVENGILWQDKIVEGVRAASGHAIQAAGFAYQGKTRHRAVIIADLLERCKRMPLNKRERYIAELLQDLNVPENALPRMMLTPDEVSQLANESLVTIGGHTRDHVILSQETLRQSEAQIRKDKDVLEAWSGHSVDCFAYPNGEPGKDFSAEHVEQLKRVGYHRAFSTADGGIDENTPAFALPRFMPYRQHPRLRALSALKIAGEVSSYE